MAYTIAKEFTFEAAHFLPSLPEGHPCKRVHGHSYRVEVILQSGFLNGHGFVRDYGELVELKTFLDTEWDHRLLNDVLGSTAPTAENIARVLFMWCASMWQETVAVRVHETAKTWAEYRTVLLQ